MEMQDVFELIVSCTREIVPGLDNHTFANSDQLDELGANSIDRAEIVMAIMESLSLTIPRVDMFGAKNIGQLAELIHDKMHRQ